MLHDKPFPYHLPGLFMSVAAINSYKGELPTHMDLSYEFLQLEFQSLYVSIIFILLEMRICLL